MPSGAEVSSPAIRLRAASLAFGSRRILADLDLEIPAGQAVALIGASGVGKTSLLRVLTGAQSLQSGSAELLGENPQQLKGSRLRALLMRVGHLYQNDALVPGLRAVHNVLVGRLGRWSLLRSIVSLIWPQDLDLAQAAMARVGLEDRLAAPISTLSGGERQRVALARLLVQDPELILADEPVAALDPRLAKDVIELLVGLAKEEGRSCLVSLHDWEMVGPYFDRVLALKDGRWFFDGPPDGIASSNLADLYAGENANGGPRA
ncbi:MAG: phosphonate ABC transporter ATP-binding protein [Planctomycetota bacterium]|jgi:phosphonate transport system ATP-binding protein